MRDLGYPAENFGIHNPQAGSATAAANAGVPDRLFYRTWPIEIGEYQRWV